ncbi:MAG: murein biosynthesis integral membrane protein MurJ [Gemmatimonadota bacterium]|nr:murein biosynthesis integral membrane protein MurJ [Gemmatimonadota bacterium]
MTDRGALLVAAGIFASRIFGLVRQHFLARYLGLSGVADAFNAAFRIPNVLQNLFGEGVLSASFIPVYSRLIARGDREEATRVAGAVASLLAMTVSVLVLLGVLATPWLIDIIVPGFEGEKRALTIRLVRILFPGAGLLALSAWCLGVLNSHRRFLLSYAAPVVWNIAIIAVLVALGGSREQEPLAVAAAWASVAGSALQLVVQLPLVLRLLGTLQTGFATASANVRTVVRNFVPVFIGRGVVQISAYVDTVLGSLLPTGAVAAITSAQALYTLPVSLFGMSVSAAELPAMSSAVGEEREIGAYLRERLDTGLRRIAFLVIPSAVAFLAIGDVLAAAVFQAGEFTRDDSRYVWAVLAGSAVGLLASTLGRLYASTFYALHDTRTPLRFALLRVGLALVLGYLLAVQLPPRVGLGGRWGAAGITLAAGLAAWVECSLLRRRLGERIGATGLPTSYSVALWGAAFAAGAAGWGTKLLVGPAHPIVVAAATVPIYGATYFGVAAALGIPESRRAFARAGGFVRRRR